MPDVRQKILLSILAATVLAGEAFASGIAEKKTPAQQDDPPALALSKPLASAGDYPQGELVVNISDHLPDWRPFKAYNADEAQILTAVYEGLFSYSGTLNGKAVSGYAWGEIQGRPPAGHPTPPNC